MPDAFKATFLTARPVPSRGVVTFSFDVATEEASAALALLGGFPTGGASVWVGIAPLVPEAAAKPDARERYAQGTEGQQAVARAGLLADDPVFRRWILPQNDRRDPAADGEVAANLIRIKCGIRSRKELATNPDALQRFLDMEARFKTERAYGPLATKGAA